MRHAALPLPPSIQRIVDLLSDAVWRGRSAIVSRCGRPDDLRRSNASAFATFTDALSTVRMLKRILRYTFIILAAWIDMPKARAVRTAGALTGPVLKDKTPARERPYAAGGPARRMSLSSTWRVKFVGERAVPAVFVNATHDPARALARHIETLTHALLHPLPYIRRLARRLRHDICFIGWRAPKRPPTGPRRTYWEELLQARDQASWELRERRWLRVDSS